VLPAFLIVFALLAGVAALTWEDDPPPGRVTPLAVVAERVEALRGLRFRERPAPLRVSPEQVRREGLADLDRSYPAARRHADEALYERLGLLPEGTDLREVSASVFGEQVAGYYDPRDGRLRVVEGPASGNRVMDEIILAHELVHALEDQAIGLDMDLAEATDDRGYAYRALVEGTATHAMFAYLAMHFEADVALGGLLAGGLAASSTTPLPPFILNALTFPYLGGQEFVAALERRGGWRLIDAALRVRPPASTEQVLHPRKWLRAETPRRVTEPSDRRLGAPDTTGTFGEWQTRELLATAGGLRRQAAAGWGGDTYASWEEAVVIRWVWDSRRDEREFRVALRDLVRSGGLRGAVRVASRGGAVTLAVAEEEAVARRLATAG
jgi:hypothetical protein